MSLLLRVFILINILFSSLAFASIGKVSLVKGEAFAQRSGQKLLLENGAAIEEKDTVSTSKEARIQLIFNDNTVITLGSLSEFKVEEYLSDSVAPKAKFKFNQGVFKTITGKIGKTAPKNFTLETKTATIGIRGTVIGGIIPPPSSNAPDSIFCLGGSIVATSMATGISVPVPSGMMTVVPPDASPEPPRAVTPQDMQQLGGAMGSPPPAANEPNSPAGTSSDTPVEASDESDIDTPPPPQSEIPETQTLTPPAGDDALQRNLQTSTQGVVVDDLAEEIGVDPQTLQDQLEEQTCPSGTIGTYPNCVAQSCPANTVGIYPDCVELTCPAGTTGTYPDCVELTCPTGTTGTYPDCVALTCPAGTTGTYPDCVALTCPAGTTGTYPDCTAIQTGGGSETPPPPQPSSYTTLFSNMSASDGATSSVIFPDETTRTMVFDATNEIWKSSDNAYIVTSTDGNFSYINELENTKTMYVKDLSNDYDPILFKSFPTDVNASGYLPNVDGLVPVPSTWHELVTSAKSVMGDEYSYAVKYEQNSYTRLWDYDSALKLFEESYFNSGESFGLNNLAALYSDISNSDTAYQRDLTSYIDEGDYDYFNFYIHGVPEANQNLKSYGILDDGGKWYFTYDNNDSNYAGTVNVYGFLPITDAVVTSSDYIPFMQTVKGYPIYVVERSGSKEMYSIKNFDSTSNDMLGYVNDHFLEINTGYVDVNGTSVTYHHAEQGYQQNVYLFYKIDEDGSLKTDERNGKIVNPITGNALNVYTNYHFYNGGYAFGPINNPLLDDTSLPAAGQDNTVSLFYGGITPLSLNIGTLPSKGADYRKLLIEKAPWSDKPDNKIYIYSDYTADSAERNFGHIDNTQTYIKFASAGDEGIMMGTHFGVAQEKDNSETLIKNHFLGAVTTGRVVSDDEGVSNKVVFKHFDTLDGIITTDSVSSYGTTHSMYLFNEKDQFVAIDNGGLDNIQEDNETKYSWLVHEEVNASTSKVAGVDLMKKVVDNSDEDLFISLDYNTSFATGAMSGFMIGGDTAANVWLGDVSAFDTNASGGRGVLTVTAPSYDLNITSPISMAGLSQTDAAETIPSASYLGEDMQAMIIESKTINGKTYDFAMATLPDAIIDTGGGPGYSYQNDYTSWGYWIATEKDVPAESRTYAQGYWVAGYETDPSVISNITSGTTYEYSGHVLGTVTDGTIVSPILFDADNSFSATIEFGAVNPVTITGIGFKTADLGTVNITDLSTSASSVIGNKFVGNATGTDTVIDLQGKFFGPDAQGIGGIWGGSFKNTADVDLAGKGVFKAILQGQQP